MWEQADIEEDRRKQAEFDKKMNDGFQRMKKTLRFRTQEEMKVIFDDLDSDGSVNPSAWNFGSPSMRVATEPWHVQGAMDARELAKLFTSLDVHLMEHEILLVIEEIDDSGDQTIDFDELLDWMQEKVWAGPLLSAFSGT